MQPWLSVILVSSYNGAEDFSSEPGEVGVYVCMEEQSHMLTCPR